MDFSDILSYPSPSNDVIHQVLSSDLHTCQRYLNACARLIHLLSDREIDIKTVHYKYRIERFLRSRSKSSRRFISTYEQRFPELALPKDQLFIYESDGNIRIDVSHPTAVSKKTPPINKSPSSSSIVEENLSVPRKSKKKKRSLVECLKERYSSVNTPSNQHLTCWTIALYTPRRSLLPTIEQQIRSCTPIRLPWIVKRPRVEISDYDLRILFYQERPSAEPFDLRFLFHEERTDAVECDLSHLFEECPDEAHSESSPPAFVSNEWFENNWDLLLLLLIVCYFIVAVATGIGLSLLCYASLGVLAYIHHVVEI